MTFPDQQGEPDLLKIPFNVSQCLCLKENSVISERLCSAGWGIETQGARFQFLFFRELIDEIMTLIMFTFINKRRCYYYYYYYCGNNALCCSVRDEF